MKRRKEHLSKFGRGVLGAAAMLAAAVCFFAAVQGLDSGRGEEGRQQLETALRRAAVACYASQGVYPPDLDYLTEHYGIQIKEERYNVFYEIFADNLMPDITVVENKP